MKRVAYVLLSLLALSVLSLAWFDLDPSLKYEVQDPIYRWIGRAIFVQERTIDTAFVGTSRVWTAVDTHEINEKRPGQYSVNLGANWFGRHSKYVVIRDMLERHPPRRLVLEVVHLEPTAEHPYTASLGSPMEIPRARFAELDLYDPETVRPAVSYFLTYELGQAVRSYYLLYRRMLGSFRAEQTYLDKRAGHHEAAVSAETQEAYWKTVRDVPPSYVPFAADATTEFHLDYLDRITALCRKHDVELYFLFLPERNGPLIGPRFEAELKRRGHLIDVPVDGLYEYRLWRNAGHFNREGTALFTERVLASELYDRP